MEARLRQDLLDDLQVALAVAKAQDQDLHSLTRQHQKPCDYENDTLYPSHPALYRP